MPMLWSNTGLQDATSNPQAPGCVGGWGTPLALTMVLEKHPTMLLSDTWVVQGDWDGSSTPCMNGVVGCHGGMQWGPHYATLSWPGEVLA